MSWLNDIKQKIRGRMKMRALAPFGVGWFVDTPQGMFVVDPVDQLISRKLIKNGGYDTGAVELLSALVGAEDTVVFVGAHIGTILVPIAKKVRSVFAYEADTCNFRFLSYNIVINGLNNVEPYNFAVGDKDGDRVQVRHDSLNSGHSSIVVGCGGDVVMVELDKHIDQDVRLIVMDIEGAEVHAIRGMQALLKKTDLLYTEFSNKFMADLGESGASFCEALGGNFPFAKIFYGENRVFENFSWVEYLKRFDEKGEGVVINCLFSKTMDALV